MSLPKLPRKISLNRIAHVYYTYKNLASAQQFLLDFGFSVTQKSSDGNRIYFRGYGTEPFLVCALQGPENEFGGVGWVVDSMEDLEIASETFPNATKILDSPAPGGGKMVTFYDEVDGYAMHLVFGQKAVEMTETFPELEYNFPTTKHREVNKTQRFNKGPAPVHKLGHFGLCVTDYDRAFEFYTTRFNLKPSEIIYLPESGKDITTFLHLDRGSEKMDHHSFFFYAGPMFHVHHTSYEVHDVDIQMLGHNWLEQKGYEICWGVGRHVMGSQIFDYWFDPAKFMMEHYVDGDLVNDETPVNRVPTTNAHLHVWGPDLPATFMQ